MQIFVKNACGKTITLEVEYFDTIQNIRKKLEDKGELVESYPLVYRKAKVAHEAHDIHDMVVLEDDKTLLFYDIPKGTTLALLNRIRRPINFKRESIY